MQWKVIRNFHIRKVIITAAMTQRLDVSIWVPSYYLLHGA